jgi:hypothetical protein
MSGQLHVLEGSTTSVQRKMVLSDKRLGPSNISFTLINKQTEITNFCVWFVLQSYHHLIFGSVEY